MKARRIWGLLLLLLGAVVLTPALMCLFWPVQAAAMPGVLQRLGEGFLRDTLLRGFRVVQDYPRMIGVASGAVTLLGLCLLLWPARRTSAMAVGADWSVSQETQAPSFEVEEVAPEREHPQKKPLRFPYPEAWDVQNPMPANGTKKPILPVEKPAAPAAMQREEPTESATQQHMEEPVPAPEGKAVPVNSSVTCPSCGAMNSERAYFCRLCGADMPSGKLPVRQENQPAKETLAAHPQKLHYVWENQPLPQVEAPPADRLALAPEAPPAPAALLEMLAPPPMPTTN